MASTQAREYLTSTKHGVMKDCSSRQSKNSSEKADSTSAGDTERAAYGTGTDIHAALSEEYADTVPELAEHLK